MYKFCNVDYCSLKYMPLTICLIILMDVTETIGWNSYRYEYTRFCTQKGMAVSSWQELCEQ